MITATKDISIIIVNFNTGDLLAECIKSIKQTITGHVYEVFVVDNASSDDSLKKAQRLYRDITIVKNRDNLGFARANNQAMQNCHGRFILLLNPDTLLVDNAVDVMIDYMDKDDSIAVVGSRLLNKDRTTQASTAGSFPYLAVVFNETFSLSKFFPKSRRFRGLYLRNNTGSAVEVDWVSGACMLVRRSVIEQVGMLNEGFFMYFEDQEWCYRIKNAGHKIIYYPAAQVIHYEKQSIGKLAVGDFRKNQIPYKKYLLNFNGPLKAFIAGKLYFFGLFLRCLLSLLKYIVQNDSESLARFKVLTMLLRSKGL
ncbi:MAG: glycosyltransferase family 2 protein [Planctomycetota bacterium]|jgi:GT2 family glycosyltransferase